MQLGAITWQPGEDGTGNAWLYVAAGCVAFDIELTLAAQARPWALGEARLKPKSPGASPIPARVARLLGASVVAPGEKARLLVEFEVPTEGALETYRLEVTEQEGERKLSRDGLKWATPATRKQ